jgi:hypothetical protein
MLGSAATSAYDVWKCTIHARSANALAWSALVTNTAPLCCGRTISRVSEWAAASGS